MIEEDGSSRRRDYSTSLRSARYDMWGRKMGPRIREDKEGEGNKIPRLRCAALVMICVRWGMRMGMDSRLRGNNGRKGGVGMREGDDEGGNHVGRDGSPHPRGQRWEGRFPNRPYGLGHGGTLFTLVTENNKQGPKVPICWERA